jgi:hypothetical protein
MMYFVTFNTTSTVTLGDEHVAFLLKEDPEVAARVKQRLNEACNTVLIEEIERLKDLIL